jgi:hypothetical protein
MFTLGSSLLFGSLGLVVDVGWAFFRREAAQTAADSAAQAAAAAAYLSAGGGSINCSVTNVACYSTEYECPSTLTTAANNIQAGCLYAKENGFTTAGRQKVTFLSGAGTAATATGAPMSYWVIARVSERIPQLFSAVLGFQDGMVTARATAGARMTDGGGCVIELNPSSSGAISMNGNTSLTTGCGVYTNSSSSSAISIVGGGTITTTGGAKTNIVGNWSGSGVISPSPVTGAASISDPLGDLAPPTVGACSDTSNPVNIGSHTTRTISPGVYCSGFNLSAQSTLNLDAGIYIIKSGITMGGQTTINGNGVFIYMLTGGVSMAGGATVNLTAPSTGTWQGVLFYQDRGNTTASTLVGGTAQLMNGVLYFPSANLTYTGGSSTAAMNTTIISDTLTLVGNSYITAAASSPYTGSAGGAFLIE